MSDKKKIIAAIDRFYVECVEEFKEAELKITADSKFRSMFRKKDYDSNIDLLRSCKSSSRSIRFPTGDIDKGDEASKELIRQTEHCIRQFNRLCDTYIQLQLALKKKSEGSKLSYKEYMKIYSETQDSRREMNRELKELDILYTDYTEDMDLDVYEFIR